MILRKPTFSVAEKRGMFRLATPMSYGWAAMMTVVHIPAGFVTDFASIPRFLRFLFAVNGKHRLSAVLHDFLYKCGGTVSIDDAFVDGTVLTKDTPRVITYTRKDADLVFYESMLLDGVNKPKAWSMYRGVRAFGWMFFNKNK